MRGLRRVLPALAFACALVAMLCTSAVASADTFDVNSNGDASNVSQCQAHAADCTLRGAIEAANIATGANTINLPADRYDRPSGNAQLEVTGGSLTINGATGDAKDVIVSADGNDRVLQVDSGASVTITGVTLQDGYTSGTGAGINLGGCQLAACVSSSLDTTTLVLDHSRVLKNVTTDDCGGGIWGDPVSNITLRSSNVDRNTALDCGGGVGYSGTGSVLQVFDSSIDGNTLSGNTCNNSAQVVCTLANTSGCCTEGGGVYTDAQPDVPLASTLAPATLDPAFETLHVERSSISNNQATNGSAGGVANESSGNPPFGDAKFVDSHLDNNFASGPAGAVLNFSGTITAQNTTFNSNSSHFGVGGAIANDGDGIDVTGGSLDSNFGYYDGGAIYSDFGPVSVAGSSVSGNQSRQGSGGAIATEECCIFLAKSSSAKPHLGKTIGSLTVTGTHVDRNFASDDGGAIFNALGDVSVTGGTMNNNETRHYRGGGVWNNAGTLSLTDTHVDNNKADNGSGGGVWNGGNGLLILRSSVDANTSGPNGENGNGARGGGVFSNGDKSLDDTPTTTITDSSISSNHAWDSGGGLWDNTGAAIVNSTLANNVSDGALDDHRGGGIFDHGANMTLTNVTLAGNLANNGRGGGIWGENDSAPSLTNTIVADNQANSDITTSNCGGTTPTTGGHNVEGTDNGASSDPCGLTDGTNGDQTNRDARIGPLQDNGGPTLTRALLTGSPAIDNGDDGVCNTLTTDANPVPHDQRGVTRPFGTHCDVGAYEVGPPPTPPQSPPASTPVTPGGSQQVLGQKVCQASVPRSSISRNGLLITHHKVKLVGRTIDFRCAGTSAAGGIKLVKVSVALVDAAKKCSFLTSSGDFTAPRSCRNRLLLRAKLGKKRNGKVPWTFKLEHLNLPAGNYIADAFGTDSDNNKESKTRVFNEKHFRLH